jgi:hypothetical protein
MDKDRLARRLIPFVYALCPYSERLAPQSVCSIAREVAAILCLQSRPISFGVLVYLWIFSVVVGVKCQSDSSTLDRMTCTHALEHSRFPIWGLFRKMLSTLIALNAFDYMYLHDPSDERKSA